MQVEPSDGSETMPQARHCTGPVTDVMRCFDDLEAARIGHHRFILGKTGSATSISMIRPRAVQAASPHDGAAAVTEDQPLPPPAPAWVPVRDPDVPEPLPILDGDFLEQALHLAAPQLQACACCYPPPSSACLCRLFCRCGCMWQVPNAPRAAP